MCKDCELKNSVIDTLLMMLDDRDYSKGIRIKAKAENQSTFKTGTGNSRVSHLTIVR